MPAGNPEAYAQMPQQAPMGGGGDIPPELIEIVTQILGRPPQSIEEIVMVLEQLQGGQPGAQQGGMNPQNAALLEAMGGGGARM